MGASALLVEVADTDAALALRARLEASTESGADPWPAIEHLVVGARTVLVVLRDARRRDDVGRACIELAAGLDPSDALAEGAVVEVPVRYDGDDLDAVARSTGLSRQEVVAAHTGTPWRVGFGGFAPGFAYLVDGDPRLRVPRRDEPRTRVPAGSVALAGDFSGIYPQDSPGGRDQILSRSEVRGVAEGRPTAGRSPW
jgi:KipI family sensor histidine kinase inhibitor